MFILVKNTLRLLISILFLSFSPFIFIVAITFSKSFKQAFDETIGIIVLPFEEVGSEKNG